MFRELEDEKVIPRGWRLATVADVTEHQQDSRDAVQGKWSICRLADGTIYGSGYGYKVESGKFTAGHKLLIRGKSCTDDSQCPSDTPECRNGYCGSRYGKIEKRHCFARYNSVYYNTVKEAQAACNSDPGCQAVNVGGCEEIKHPIHLCRIGSTYFSSTRSCVYEKVVDCNDDSQCPSDKPKCNRYGYCRWV